MRLIDADALKRELGDTRDGEPIFRDTEFVRMDIVGEAIDQAPTIERPHGEWIETYYSIDGVGASRFKCTKCEKEISTYGEPYNFCPNCGADMRKEGEAE